MTWLSGSSGILGSSEWRKSTKHVSFDETSTYVSLDETPVYDVAVSFDGSYSYVTIANTGVYRLRAMRLRRTPERRCHNMISSELSVLVAFPPAVFGFADLRCAMSRADYGSLRLARIIRARR